MIGCPAEDRPRRARSRRQIAQLVGDGHGAQLTILLAPLELLALPDLPVELGVALRQHCRIVQVLLVLTHESAPYICLGIEE
jgi:hypothetical protein